MMQAISIPDVKSEYLHSGALAMDVCSPQTEQEESIMDKADFAAASTQKRLTHEQVFGALRGKFHA